jgi:hypothetical protein
LSALNQNRDLQNFERQTSAVSTDSTQSSCKQSESSKDRRDEKASKDKHDKKEKYSEDKHHKKRPAPVPPPVVPQSIKKGYLL